MARALVDGRRSRSRLGAGLFEARARFLPDIALPNDLEAPPLEIDGARRLLLPPVREGSEKWLAPLYAGFDGLVAVDDSFEEGMQPGMAVVLGRLVARSGEVRLAIDYLDASRVYPAVVDAVDVYFKMQYAEEGYGDRRIVPGGYPTAGNAIYGCLGRLRSLRHERRFDFDVHARFGTEFRPRLRGRAVELLRESDALVTIARLERRRYYQYLYEIARSKVCLDLPGEGAFCFRLVDYLAIGSCVVAYPHDNRLPEPLEDGHNVVYVQPDLSDLVAKCTYYATHDAEREEIARNAARYFDCHLHREQLAAHYLRTCMDYGVEGASGRSGSRISRDSADP